jgi:hypothetical protein
MTEYHLTPPTILPSLAVQAAKEKRRKVLEKAWQTRRENYVQFMRKKRQLQASGDLL